MTTHHWPRLLIALARVSLTHNKTQKAIERRFQTFPLIVHFSAKCYGDVQLEKMIDGTMGLIDLK